jgi:hypothetical protein
MCFCVVQKKKGVADAMIEACQIYGISDGHGVSLMLRLAWPYFNSVFYMDKALVEYYFMF